MRPPYAATHPTAGFLYPYPYCNSLAYSALQRMTDAV